MRLINSGKTFSSFRKENTTDRLNVSVCVGELAVKFSFSILDIHFPIAKFKDAISGHWHTPTKFYLNGITVRVSGSTESYNVYAQEKMAAMGEPSQPFLFVHPKKGRVTAEYQIELTNTMKLSKSLEDQ